MDRSSGSFAQGWIASAADCGERARAFSHASAAIDLRPVYGRRPRTPGAHYFFFAAFDRIRLQASESVSSLDGAADEVDPGGWTRSRRATSSCRSTRTRFASGSACGSRAALRRVGKMAAEITAALRAFDPDDPVRYDFALCHLSMMGACGFGTTRGCEQCPLREHCHPGPRATNTRRATTVTAVPL
jgi:hypothetical protein